MDEFNCPWCGADLLDLFASMKPCSYDAVYEAHVEDCEPFRREQFPEEFNNNSEPPCSRDGE